MRKRKKVIFIKGLIQLHKWKRMLWHIQNWHLHHDHSKPIEIQNGKGNLSQMQLPEKIVRMLLSSHILPQYPHKSLFLLESLQQEQLSVEWKTNRALENVVAVGYIVSQKKFWNHMLLPFTLQNCEPYDKAEVPYSTLEQTLLSTPNNYSFNFRNHCLHLKYAESSPRTASLKWGQKYSIFFPEIWGHKRNCGWTLLIKVTTFY